MGETEAAPVRALELTARALIAGSVLGAVLAAANVYTGLKTSAIDGGNITASVLAVAIFRGARRPFGPLENNLSQTVAASAAVMASTVGVLGPLPALAMSGFRANSGLIVAWGLALGALGVLIAVVLRPQLISADGLPFPTGVATAEVIAAIASGTGSALRRAWALLLAAAFAAALGWMRDGPAWLPQAVMLPGAVFGLPLATLSLGVSVSPLLLSTGLLIGARAAGGMLLGSLLGWAVLVPWLVQRGVLPADDQARMSDWLIWPGASLMLASSFTSLALEWPAITRGLKDLRKLSARREANAPDLTKPLLALASLSFLSVALVARLAFDLGTGATMVSLLLGVVLAGVCARSAGETDVAPVGAMGSVAQLMLGGSGPVASLSAGSVACGAATHTAQTLWAFKTGERLGASLKAQIVGALLGVGVGAAVVVPTYAVLERAYGIGTARMPAPGVMSWKVTADAVQGGLSALPPFAATAAGIALVFGVLASLLAHTRYGRFVVSPVTLGIGMLTPVTLGATVFLGGLLLLLLNARWPAWSEEHVSSIAGGAIAGESLFAVVLAALIASGVFAS